MNETRSFEHTPESVAAARRFATDLLRASAGPDTLEAIQLMVSELATNCIRHTDSGFDLTIIRDAHRIRVEATDRGAGEPMKRSPKPTDPSGRGLQIVDMLSTDWGCRRGPDVGKTVWFTLTIHAPSPAEYVVGASELVDRAPEQRTISKQAGRARRSSDMTRPRAPAPVRGHCVAGRMLIPLANGQGGGHATAAKPHGPPPHLGQRQRPKADWSRTG